MLWCRKEHQLSTQGGRMIGDREHCQSLFESEQICIRVLTILPVMAFGVHVHMHVR